MYNALQGEIADNNEKAAYHTRPCSKRLTLSASLQGSVTVSSAAWSGSYKLSSDMSLPLLRCHTAFRVCLPRAFAASGGEPRMRQKATKNGVEQIDKMIGIVKRPRMMMLALMLMLLDDEACYSPTGRLISMCPPTVLR